MKGNATNGEKIMTVRWLGVSVTGEKATIVDASVSENETEPIIINKDFTLSLQKGEKSEAYTTLHRELADYAREQSITTSVVKASAVSQKSKPTLALLHSAELRGVVIAALASVCKTKTVAKASMSKNIGERNVDDYTKDNEFWNEHFEGSVRAGSKEAAFCILTESRK